jgi:epoxyqueuosine reductase
MIKAEAIEAAALNLNYEQCGIIPLAEIDDYTERLNERIKRFPETRQQSERLYTFAQLNRNFPWAKSIVIAVRRYGKYRIPPHLKGLIGTYYCVDGRRDERSPDYQASCAFEEYLNQQGLRTFTERKFGLTALRWAALKAGLGTIRQNNFFYTHKSGSWVYLEAWLINSELELKHQDAQKPCPEDCHRCIRRCPTQSLGEPYSMNRSTCVSYLTTFGPADLCKEPHHQEMGQWIFGCDACQDGCPFNHGKWSEDEEFPGLDALATGISLEKILAMDYDVLRKVMAPKFWYISEDRVYKWKINVLNAMGNTFHEGYLPVIRKAAADPHEAVRAMAEWVTARVSAPPGSEGKGQDPVYG